MIQKPELRNSYLERFFRVIFFSPRARFTIRALSFYSSYGFASMTGAQKVVYSKIF